MSTDTLDTPTTEQPTSNGVVMAPVPALHKKTFTPSVLRRLKVRALKPPGVRWDAEDPDDITKAKFFVTFITQDADFKEIPCDYALWKRLSGYKNSKATKPATKGYSVIKADHHVWLGLSVENGDAKPGAGKDFKGLVAVKIDTAPMHDYMHNTVPVGAREIDNITVTIDPTSGSMNVGEYPLGYSEHEVNRILIKLDALPRVYAGLELAEGVMVDSVVGDKVVISVV